MNNFFSDDLTRRSFLGKLSLICCQAALASVLPKCLGAGATTGFGSRKTGSSTVSASDFAPAYLRIHRNGELGRRGDILWSMMEKCRLCPRECGVNRLRGQRGFCQAPGVGPMVSSFSPHFGEERPLVGRGGSGTIFLTHCGLRCVFCQNWEISHSGRGSRKSLENLAGMMLALQKRGCHNINFVTPTHYSAAIVKALDIAAGEGLRLPVVWNTCGWESPEIMRLLDGIVDIYLPDFKFWDGAMAARFMAGADSYPSLTRNALLEMNRQVGVAMPGSDGVVSRGLMIRHLVMPGNTGGSDKIMEWIGANLPKDTYVNIMAQYNPQHKAFDFPEISRRITRDEYQAVVKAARRAGLSNLDIRGVGWLR